MGERRCFEEMVMLGFALEEEERGVKVVIFSGGGTAKELLGAK